MTVDTARLDLRPGEEARIRVTLNREQVRALPPSMNRSNVELRRAGQSKPSLVVPFELMLLPQPAKLEARSTTEFRPVGSEDGSFFPRKTRREFVNEGDISLAWRVETNADWLDVKGGRAGHLNPGEVLDFEIAVDEWLAGLRGTGDHEAQIQIFDRHSDQLLHAETVVMNVTSGIMMRNGWSVLRGSPGSRIVYVSDSLGNDANNGFSPQTAKRTIAAGKALMRHGEPDYLLLRRGDVFDEGLGQWMTSGRSETEPQVVSTYGPRTVRPILRTGTDFGLVTHGGYGSPPTIDNVAFVGLHFYAHTHTGSGVPIGIGLYRPSTNVLIEDCRVEKYNTGLVIQAIDGRHNGVRLRRSVIVDSFGVNEGNPQGLYCVFTDGFLIEECIFDTNGWQPTIPGAGADIFSHNIYIAANNSSVIVRGNIISNGASHGLQMRAGGVTHNNFFARNAIAFMMSGGAGPERDTSTATYNVIVDGKDIDEVTPRGWGIEFNNVVGGEIRSNIVANSTRGGIRAPLTLDGASINGGVHNVSMTDNIVWNWGGSVYFNGDETRITNITFSNNSLQNGVDSAFLINHFALTNHLSVFSEQNSFYSKLRPIGTWMQRGGLTRSVPEWKQDLGDSSSKRAREGFANPNRTLGDYAARLGLAPTHEAFMSAVRLQSKYSWHRGYTAQSVNNWFRSNF